MIEPFRLLDRRLWHYIDVMHGTIQSGEQALLRVKHPDSSHWTAKEHYLFANGPEQGLAGQSGEK